MSKAYTITLHDVLSSPTHFGFVHDHGESISRLEQYIADGDYFGSLATHLDIMAQTFNKKVVGAGHLSTEYKLYMNRIRDELEYLQKHYKIVKKETSDELVG